MEYNIGLNIRYLLGIQRCTSDISIVVLRWSLFLQPRLASLFCMHCGSMQVPCMKPACFARRDRRTTPSTQETTPVHWIDRVSSRLQKKIKPYSIERQQWPFEYTWGCNGAFHPSAVTKVTWGEAMGYCDSKINLMQNFSP